MPEDEVAAIAWLHFDREHERLIYQLRSGARIVDAFDRIERARPRTTPPQPDPASMTSAGVAAFGARLAEAHPRPAAVRGDEFDSGGFQGVL